MSSRPTGVTILANALAFLPTLLFAASAPQDPLWRKAVAVSDANAGWVAGLTVTRYEAQYKGESLGVNEMWRRSTLGQKGEVLTETIKVLEDGKDVTRKEKAKSKEKDDTEGKRGGGNPFDSAVQDRVSLKAADRSRVIAGHDCAGYTFELKNTNGPAVRGTAWLEKETGIPTEIDNMTLDPLPDKHLKRLTFTTRYETTTNGTWHLKSIQTTGTVSKFFISADIQSTTTFSEYWKKPEQQKTPRNGSN